MELEQKFLVYCAISILLPCRTDLDGNGVLDPFDFLAFVNGFNEGCP